MREPTFSPKVTAEVERYLSLLGSVVKPKKAAYVAVPITTGPRFLDWYASRGRVLERPRDYDTEHHQAVRVPNCADAALRIAALRKTVPYPLIDPSAFDRQGWSQETYRSFWAAVIRRYARLVIFLDGWQYSNGCANEFLTAVRTRLKTVREDRTSLSRKEGLRLLRNAATEYERHGLPAAFLVNVIQALESNDARADAR
jgi:hypothetical protein